MVAMKNLLKNNYAITIEQYYTITDLFFTSVISKTRILIKEGSQMIVHQQDVTGKLLAKRGITGVTTR